MKTLIETIRGGNQLCYAPPISQSVKDERRNTYTSLSSGNRPDLRGVSTRISLRRKSSYKSPLFSSSPSDGSLSLSPTLYTHTAHGCWDELNYGEKQHD